METTFIPLINSPIEIIYEKQAFVAWGKDPEGKGGDIFFIAQFGDGDIIPSLRFPSMRKKIEFFKKYYAPLKNLNQLNYVATNLSEYRYSKRSL